MTSASFGITAIFGGVSPARFISAACPEMMPPVGRDTTVVMPTTRATPMCALCGSMP